MDFLVTGARRRELMCRLVTKGDVVAFIDLARCLGVDPLGEYGEYHTPVVRCRDVSIPYSCRAVEQYGNCYTARL